MTENRKPIKLLEDVLRNAEGTAMHSRGSIHLTRLRQCIEAVEIIKKDMAYIGVENSVARENFEFYFKKYIQATGKTVLEAEEEWLKRNDSPQDYFKSLTIKAEREAQKAIIKFPQPNYVSLKIAEEAGEVVRGCVHYAEGRLPWHEVEREVVQLMAMLYRLVNEGDQVNGVIPPTQAPEVNNG